MIHLQLSDAARSAPPVVESIHPRFLTHLRCHVTVPVLGSQDRAEVHRAISTMVRLQGALRQSTHGGTVE